MNKINDLKFCDLSKTRGLEDRAMIVKFSKSRMSTCISGHLDVSPCHAVIICLMSSYLIQSSCVTSHAVIMCHMSCSHHMSHTRVRPRHVQPAVKYLFCPELQQIFAAFVKI